MLFRSYYDSESAHLIKHRHQEDVKKNKKTILPEIVPNGLIRNENCLVSQESDIDDNFVQDREPLLASTSVDQEDELGATIIDEHSKEEETSFAIALQVLFPFLIAGFGTVSAGLLLDFVQVSILFFKLAC